MVANEIRGGSAAATSTFQNEQGINKNAPEYRSVFFWSQKFVFSYDRVSLGGPFLTERFSNAAHF